MDENWMKDLDLSISRDRCLNSTELRKLTEAEVISGGDKSTLEKRIQPSTFETTLGDEIFILDLPNINLFRPVENEEVYRTLLQIPSKRRIKEDISEGFELKVGHTYLFPLEEKLSNLADGLIVKSSPKSSMGRVFNDNRMLFDYSSSLNELRVGEANNSSKMWLMVQPKAFNTIIGPGLTMNQLRLMTGSNAQLTSQELLEEHQNHGLVYDLTVDKELVKMTNPIFTHEGVRLTLDLEGELTNGVVGLKATGNPMPIDLRSAEKKKLEEYFEPQKSDKRFSDTYSLTIEPGEPHLFTSLQYVNIPSHLCADLKPYSEVSIQGLWHRAGFFDCGFTGTGTMEVTSDEEGKAFLVHNMPISDLTFFHVDSPDKLYGEKIGSNYQGQIGVRPAKWFSFPELGFGELAKDFEKLNKKVLVVPTEDMLSVRENALEDGFEPATASNSQRIEDVTTNQSFFMSRYNCEGDELLLQPIPYVFVTDQEKDSIWVYERTKKIQDFGDKRLFGKLSMGFGGHIHQADAPNYILNCLDREVFTEELAFSEDYSEPIFVGTFMSHEQPVDRVHFGLVYAVDTKGEVSSNEASITSVKKYNIFDLQEQYRAEKNPERYETWTGSMVKHLPSIFDTIRNNLK